VITGKDGETALLKRTVSPSKLKEKLRKKYVHSMKLEWYYPVFTGAKPYVD